MVHNSPLIPNPPALRVGKVLRSRWTSATSHPCTSPGPITLVTHMSWDRRGQLLNTVRAWAQGRCVVAVWLPQDCAPQAAELHQRFESGECGAACAVDLVLIFCSGEHTRYPINALRNAALAHATTDLVLLSDVDQQPSDATCARLHNSDVLSMLWSWCCCDRELVVIPAFEVAPGSGHAIPADAYSKPGLVRRLQPPAGEPGGASGAGSGGPRMVSFQTTHYARGHGPTRALEKWVQCDNFEGYKVEYEVSSIRISFILAFL